MAKQQIKQSPKLRTLCVLWKHSIADESTSSMFIPLSSEADNLDGLNAHMICVDEVHKQANRDLIDVLETSQGSRTQPLLLLITTADEEGESVCNEKYDYACKVRDAVIEDRSFFPVIYEALKDDDWTDPKVWAKANPNLGVSVDLGYFRRQFEKAKESAQYENTFKRLHLNMRTEQDSRWLSMDKWDACGDGVSDPVVWRYEMLSKLKEKAGNQARLAGLDIGSISDLTAFVLLADYEERTVMIPFFWMPSDGLARLDHRNKALYQAWINQGFITTTEGDVADYLQICEDIETICNDYNIIDIGIDAIFQGASVYTMLTQEGYKMVTIPQTWKGLTAATKEFEERVIAGNISHGNNPVLRWMASNVGLQTDDTGKLMRPMKPKNKKALKIDGIVAAIMGLARQIVYEDNASIYDKLVDKEESMI